MNLVCFKLDLDVNRVYVIVYIHRILKPFKNTLYWLLLRRVLIFVALHRLILCQHKKSIKQDIATSNRKNANKNFLREHVRE